MIMSRNNDPKDEKKPRAIDVDSIDLEKLSLTTTTTPGSDLYASSRGSAPIKTIDKKHIVKRGIEAMSEQSDIQMQQIMDQIKLLASQVDRLKEKKKLSYIIYGAEMNFKPIVGESYYLYQQSGDYLLSILSPGEWGEKHMREKSFIARVYLSGDYSWEIIEQAENIKIPHK